ncbi:hypothetical protein JTB14_016117 [Gonioctena quinquepunctata]|nr:hypothetical protein JTB14_016117 [Gonioctena quinquepunctata]
MSSAGRRPSEDSMSSGGLGAEGPLASSSEEIKMAFSTARTQMTAMISSLKESQNKKESLITIMEAMSVAFNELTEINCQTKTRQDCFDEIGKKLDLIVLALGGGNPDIKDCNDTKRILLTEFEPSVLGLKPDRILKTLTLEAG